MLDFPQSLRSDIKSRSILIRFSVQTLTLHTSFWRHYSTNYVFSSDLINFYCIAKFDTSYRFIVSIRSFIPSSTSYALTVWAKVDGSPFCSEQTSLCRIRSDLRRSYLMASSYFLCSALTCISKDYLNFHAQSCWAEIVTFASVLSIFYFDGCLKMGYSNSYLSFYKNSDCTYFLVAGLNSSKSWYIILS